LYSDWTHLLGVGTRQCHAILLFLQSSVGST
jgi:hypothetical protein